MPELVVIFVIALLVFGPKELPKIGKSLGKAMAEFRRASDELKEGIQREIELAEREERGKQEVTPTPVAAEATVAAEPPVAPAAPEPQLELPMAADAQQTNGPEAPKEPAATAQAVTSTEAEPASAAVPAQAAAQPASETVSSGAATSAAAQAPEPKPA